MRVALDTNVLVAAFATRGLCADLVRVVLAEHELVIGANVFDELRRALATKIRLPKERIDEIEALLATSAVKLAPVAHRSRVRVRVRVPVRVRDAADELILDEAIAGGAEILVTGDRDLLDAARRSPIPIVTPRGFWERLRARE